MTPPHFPFTFLLSRRVTRNLRQQQTVKQQSLEGGGRSPVWTMSANKRTQQRHSKDAPKSSNAIKSIGFGEGAAGQKDLICLITSSELKQKNEEKRRVRRPLPHPGIKIEFGSRPKPPPPFRARSLVAADIPALPRAGFESSFPPGLGSDSRLSPAVV